MTRAARKGQNEAWFRELNERLEQRAVAVLGQSDAFQIVCECSAEECTNRIMIAFEEYERVRSEPVRFVLFPDHFDPSCEVVVAEGDEYEIVEKFGDAAEQAELEDPRTDD